MKERTYRRGFFLFSARRTKAILRLVASNDCNAPNKNTNARRAAYAGEGMESALQLGTWQYQVEYRALAVFVAEDRERALMEEGLFK
jgi:hypothetical protein